MASLLLRKMDADLHARIRIAALERKIPLYQFAEQLLRSAMEQLHSENPNPEPRQDSATGW